MIRCSVAIMAHPRREAQVGPLLEKLDRPAEVVWDRIDNRWDTGKRSMLAYDPACSHHAVLQEDTLICRDLIAGLEKALAYIPEGAPLCGYVGRRRPSADKVARGVAQAITVGASFLTIHTLNWGPLIVVPTAAIPAMIAFSDPLRDIPNYDRRLSRYWELEAKIRIWYTWPSLVDHADGPSLVKGRLGTDRSKPRSAPRIAHLFAGEDVSALDLDWSGPVVDVEQPAVLKPRLEKRRALERKRVPKPKLELVTIRHTSGREITVPKGSARARRYAGLPSWELLGG